ncbi:hypothetical protein LPJ55_001393 [Coemansia sp. RSA 990]|nr:hypothetical protein LPJ55_001393 [Coemansia sp. RSA 990]KAJ2673322.1 hypothetical protein IWW42_002332 [Coemansia sp. RSA 1085]
MRQWNQQQPAGRPPPPPPPQSHIRNLGSLPPMVTEEERKVIDKMAETQVRNPELVDMVKQAQKDNPKYQFLFTHSPLHSYFQRRVAQLEEIPGSNTVSPVNLQRPPPPRPPLTALASQDPLPVKQTCTHKYYELPASLMVEAIDQDDISYSPLHASKLEDPEFLESIVPGLATYTTDLPSPETTDELDQALKAFDKGVRYIYKEDEFEFRDDPLELATYKGRENIDDAVDIDKNGWTPGVLEKVLWDRRKGGEQRLKWERKQERVKRRLEGETVETESESSSASSETSSSSSESESSDSDSSSLLPARPTSINKAIGSDNKGFQLLSKLGWQQGQGLGASSEGIVEPVRLSTRFSTIKSTRGKSSHKAKGKQVQRASLGTGRIETPLEQTPEPDTEDIYETYRMNMSTMYKNKTTRKN